MRNTIGTLYTLFLMKINVILDRRNSGWILEKFARNLHANLNELGHFAIISERPNANFDINHFMSYAFAQGTVQSKTSFFITHIDDSYKLYEVKKKCLKYDYGICMSKHMRDYIIEHTGLSNIKYVLPAHDSIIKPQAKKILFTTRIYPDGRKNEKWIYDFFSVFSSDEIEFLIHGDGWEHVIEKIRSNGFKVSYSPSTDNFENDYLAIQESIKIADYYCYLGFDEGSMGTLDAKLARVPCIVSAQGFHLDVCDQMDFLFTDRQAFTLILRDLRKNIFGEKLVDRLNWLTYAEQHLQIWQGKTCSTQNLTEDRSLEKSSIQSDNDIYASQLKKKIG